MAGVSAADAAVLEAHQAVGNPIRIIGVFLLVLYVFIRYSMVHEAIHFSLGVNPHLVALLAPPVTLLALLGGAIRRSFRFTAAYFWLAFGAWLCLALPFSAWRGGSLEQLNYFMRTEWPMLFLLAGMPMTIRECRWIMYAIAASAVVNVVFGQVFSDQMGDRLAIEFGSIRNPNDLGMHLLVGLPFLFFVILERSWLLRIAAIGVGMVSFLKILSTGSRASLLAFLVGGAFVAKRASGVQRLAIAAALVIVLCIGVAVTPDHISTRLGTLFTREVTDDVSLEAVGTSHARRYLAERAIAATISNPLFGVGMAQFAETEATLAKAEGRRASWQTSHNAYLQVSSETGIPALLFYLGAITATSVQLLRTRRLVRDYPGADVKEISRGLLCVSTALVMLCTSLVFVSQAFRFYLPMMLGLALAYVAASRMRLAELKRESTAFGSPALGPTPAPTPSPARAPRRPKWMSHVPSQ